MSSTITRRRLLQGTAGTALLVPTGCFFLVGLLRLGVRGSLLRTGARAARTSRRGQLASFGRLGATTVHILRATRAINTISRLQRVGEVFGQEDGFQAIAVDSDASLTECKVDGVPISNTRIDGRWLVHHSNFLQTPIGTSYAPKETELVHRDTRDRFVGAEIVEGSRIKHIDKDQNVAGITPFVQREVNGNTEVELAESSYLESEFESASADLSASQRESLRDTAELRALQEACLARPSSADCEDLVVRAQDVLSRLEERYE